METESELGEKVQPTDEMYHPPSKLRKPISEEKARKIKMTKIFIPGEKPLDISMHFPDREWIDITLPNEFIQAKR